MAAFVPVFAYGLWRVVTAMKYHPAKPLRAYPPIGVVVPVYNGASTIEETLKSLIRAYYPNRKDIIVVDDGSTDGTREIIQKYPVTLIAHRFNQGKRAAIELGILETQARSLPFVVTVDADTTIESQALTKLIAYFDDWYVGAVCGNIRVKNHSGALTGIVSAEYWWSINFVRTGQSGINSVLIAAGCFSAFRNAALAYTDVWQHTNVAEDMDLSTYTLQGGWKNKFALDAVAHTKSPSTLRKLFKQRVRWFRGNLQLQHNRTRLFSLRGTFMESVLNLLFNQLGVFAELYSLFVAVALSNLYLGIGVWLAANFLGIWSQCLVAEYFEHFNGKLRFVLMLPIYNILFMKTAFVYAFLTAWKRQW